VADLRDGLAVELIPVRLANAVEVRSRARDARDRRLRLWEMLPLEEWLTRWDRGESVDCEVAVVFVGAGGG
jgi:hypothetical protein